MSVKKVIRTENTLFKNSQCLLVEYSDVLKTPFFLLMSACRQSSMVGKIFDLSEIKDKSISELYLWYLHRKNFNPYRDFKIITEIENFDDGFYDYLLKAHLNTSEVYYNTNTELLFSKVLKDLLHSNDSNFLHKVIIYDEFGNSHTEEDVKRLYHSDSISVSFMTGDFKEVLKQVPNDSSYVLADMTRINDMIEMNRLNYSSILIPYEFDYNIDQDVMSYKVDLEDLEKEYTFKINFFKNTLV